LIQSMDPEGMDMDPKDPQVSVNMSK